MAAHDKYRKFWNCDRSRPSVPKGFTPRPRSFPKTIRLNSARSVGQSGPRLCKEQPPPTLALPRNERERHWLSTAHPNNLHNAMRPKAALFSSTTNPGIVGFSTIHPLTRPAFRNFQHNGGIRRVNRLLFGRFVHQIPLYQVVNLHQNKIREPKNEGPRPFKA